MPKRFGRLHLLYLGRVRWALRKITLPVEGSGLVLDVGSGGKPYPRSDILLDRMTGSEHRNGIPMMADRPTILGNAANMPFKNKAFDFVVASHILEHMPEPELFLNELMRVGKAGYIETPNAIFERLQPFSIHCLEVSAIGGKLHILKKMKPVADEYLGNLKMLESDKGWKEFFKARPDLFHVRHFWRETIHREIYNKDVSCQWIETINENSHAGEMIHSYVSQKRGWREVGLQALGAVERWRRAKRLKKINILALLACPACHCDLKRQDSLFLCVGCAKSYAALPYPDFTRPL